MQRRGFTLIELTIYLFLFLLAGMALYQLYTFGTASQRNTISSYLVSGDAETTVRWLRRDLQETTLVSMHAYPNDNANENPGCSFLSPRNVKDDQLNLVPGQGGPLWTKQVYYTLVGKKGDRLGQLTRWERELDANEKDNVPRPSNMMPSSMAGSERKVLLKQVLLPDQNVDLAPGAAKGDKFGGFRVQFVQRAGGEGGDETLSDVNPTNNDKVTNIADSTRLVEVELKILSQDNSKPNFYTVCFRVFPQYPQLR